MLERDVVVGAAARVRRLFGEGRRRGGGAPRGRALGAAHELHALGDDFGGRALLAVLALPVARLEPPLDEDLAALVEVLTARLGLLADRKSTRLNSSHSQISYAVFCLKKKKAH